MIPGTLLYNSKYAAAWQGTGAYRHQLYTVTLQSEENANVTMQSVQETCAKEHVQAVLHPRLWAGLVSKFPY